MGVMAGGSSGLVDRVVRTDLGAGGLCGGWRGGGGVLGDFGGFGGGLTFWGFGVC